MIFAWKLLGKGVCHLLWYSVEFLGLC